MEKKLAFIVAAAAFVSITPVHAHCPLCTAATGSAVATARFYGLGDATSGLLLGAFVVSGSMWMNNVLIHRRKGREFPYQLAAIFVLSMLSVLFAIYTSFYDELLGWMSISLLVYGLIAGSALSYSAFQFHYWLQERYHRSFIRYQGLMLNVLAMLLAISIVYLITGST
jgi:hypothetical protein